MGAIDSSVPGRLIAFDANTLKELWSDSDLGFFAKFNPPTIADGKVFVANFGPLTDLGCSGNYNGGKPKKACGQVRVYGLGDFLRQIPIELRTWPYYDFGPGPVEGGVIQRGF
jgi:hypothetical protein